MNRHSFIRGAALAVATVGIATVTVFSAGSAWAIDSGSAAPGSPPPPPTGGDGQHQPGEPCGNGGRYAWEYSGHYGGWILVCK